MNIGSNFRYYNQILVKDLPRYNYLVQRDVALATPSGRKSAYVARNRKKILLAAQEVLAENGSESTVEAVSDKAEIAISTIYKHFETRDALFQAAIAGAMLDWESWAFSQVADNASALEKLVTPARLLFRLVETHPLYAKMLSTSPEVMFRALPQLTAHFSQDVRELASEGVLAIDDVEIRLRNLRGAFLQTFLHKLENPETSNSEVDKAMELALALIGVPADAAHEVCSKPISKI